MKRLIFSDLHLHPWAYGATVTEKGFNSRLWAQKLALDEMLAYVKEHDIKDAYFLGDLFHTHGHVSTQALSVATDFFWKLRENNINIRAIVGNHDMASKNGRIHALNFLEKCNEVAYGGSCYWVDRGVHIHGLSYTENDDTIKRFLDTCSNTGGIILLHQGVANVPLGSGYIIDEKLKPELIPDNCVAFAGHYHFYRRVSQNLTVVGNLTGLNWSDANQSKGWTVYDDSIGSIEHIPQTVAPDFISFNTPQEQTDIQGNFVRLNYPVALDAQEEIRKSFLEAGALAVEFSHMLIEENETTIMKAGEELTVSSLITAFERKDMAPRRLEVGKEIRETSYETPTL